MNISLRIFATTAQKISFPIYFQGLISLKRMTFKHSPIYILISSAFRTIQSWTYSISTEQSTISYDNLDENDVNQCCLQIVVVRGRWYPLDRHDIAAETFGRIFCVPPPHTFNPLSILDLLPTLLF